MSPCEGTGGAAAPVLHYFFAFFEAWFHCRQIGPGVIPVDCEGRRWRANVCVSHNFVFQSKSYWKVGFLPAVCNQGLFAFLVSTSSRAGYQLTGPFSGMTCARGLASRPAICAGSPPVSPSLLGSNHKTRQKNGGGRKGQRGGVLGSPFPGFRAFTKQGLLKFSLSFV